MWRLIAKALGDKEGLTDKEADCIAMMRLSVVVLNIVCAIVIIAGNIRHW